MYLEKAMRLGNAKAKISGLLIHICVELPNPSMNIT